MDYFYQKKIIKPIICYQPFIVLPNPYYLKELEDLGISKLSQVIIGMKVMMRSG